MRKKLLKFSIVSFMLLLMFMCYCSHLQKNKILSEIFTHNKYKTMTFVMNTNYESQETIDSLEIINHFFDYLHGFNYRQEFDTGTHIQELGNCVFYIESEEDIIVINIFSENTISFRYSRFGEDKSYNLLCKTNSDISIEKLRMILGKLE